MSAMARRVSILAAMAKNRVIGIENRLPWHLPEDLKHFKALTLGHTLLMGRKTFESIGRPLPGRRTVIISRDPAYRVEGCMHADSIPAALALCGEDAEVFFVGGGEIYRQALPRADRLYLTEIQANYAGDAYFPEFNAGDWLEVEREKHRREDGLAYHFVVYERRPQAQNQCGGCNHRVV